MNKQQAKKAWRREWEKWKRAMERWLPGAAGKKKDMLHWQPAYQPVRKQ